MKPNERLLNIADSLTATIRERLANTFFSSFLIAWCISNFKLIITIIGKGEFREKIDFINVHGLADYSTRSSQLLWTPLSVAAAYVTLYPLFRIAILTYDAWTKRLQRKAVRLAEGIPVASEDETRILIENWASRYKELESDVEKYKADLMLLSLPKFNIIDEIYEKLGAPLSIYLRDQFKTRNDLVKLKNTTTQHYKQSRWGCCMSPVEFMTTIGIPKEWADFVNSSYQTIPEKLPEKYALLDDIESEQKKALDALVILELVEPEYLDGSIIYRSKGRIDVA